MTLLTSFGLCLLGLLVASPFLGAEADSCARGWLYIQGNCYAYFDIKKTWQQAEIDCQSYGRGAHLSSILSASESYLVAQHIQDYQNEVSDVWIGLEDPSKKRRWRWSDGAVFNYRRWMEAQPDDYAKSEYCVELRLSTNFLEWNDIPCTKQNAYICKHEL